MGQISTEHAYYIKLGESGKWADSSIKENKARIGWPEQKRSDINARKWGKIQKQIQNEKVRNGVLNRGSATTDCNALKLFTESTDRDVWITFHQSHLWWCQPAKGEVEQDSDSKYRKVKTAWSNVDVTGNELLIERLPGVIYQLQRFQGTICRVKEVIVLRRLINHEFSPEHDAVATSKKCLISDIERGLKGLTPKEFELLVDLVFTRSGWRRISVVGKSKEYSDFDLEDPITHDMYSVQVKSKANEKDFKIYRDAFRGRSYRRLFFVVHTPQGKLGNVKIADNQDDVKLMLGGDIAEKVVDLGLVDWLKDRIR